MGNPLGEIYSQDVGQGSLDSGQGGMQNGGEAQGTGFNPNFQPLLNELPQDLHEKIIPHLQQWDRGVNERFERLQSDYAPYKPILSSGVTPDMIQNGLNLMNLLDTNPEGLYKALQDSYKFGQEPDQGAGGQGQPPTTQQPPIQPDPYDARLQQMDQNFTQLAQHVLDMRRQDEESRQDALVAREFADAHKKVGDFDDQWVRAHCIADPSLSVEQAAMNYQSWYSAEMAKNGARPLITGSSGGGVPGHNVDPTKWSAQETRRNVADLIRRGRSVNQ